MDKLEWIKTASADEIVEDLIDTLHQADNKQRVALMQAFAERAGKDNSIGILFEAFLGDRMPNEGWEPAACIGRDMILRPEFATEVDGVRYTRTLDIGKAVLKREYRRLLNKEEN